MTIDEQIEIVRDWAGPLTEEEDQKAREMLETPATTFGGSYAPPFVARWLLMHRQAGKQAA